MKYSIFVRENNQSDSEQVALWERNLNNLNEDRFKWFYEDNPAGRPITILATAQTGDLVGSCSLFRRRVTIDNKPCLMGIAADFAVDEKHRVFGPALKMQRLLVERAEKEGFDLLFAYPNNNSRALFERVGYQKLGTAYYGLKILRSRDFLSKKLRQIFLLSVFSALVDFFILLSDRLLLKIPKGGQYTEPGFRGSDQYNTFMQRQKATHEISGIKDGSYLQWRYINNPTKEYRFINLFDSYHNLQGFLIYSNNNGNVSIEELCTDNSKKNRSLLLSKLNDEVRTNGAKQISFEYYGNKATPETLKTHLFFVREGNRNCYLKILNKNLPQEALLDGTYWHLFESEMDL